MHKLGEIIKKNKKSIAKRGYDYFVITSAWREIVDDYLAAKAYPVKIISGRLYINVLEPIWAQQLNLLKKTIIERINKKIGKGKVDNIQFQIGEVELQETNEEKVNKTTEKISEDKSKKETGEERLRDIHKKQGKYRRLMGKKGYKECDSCGTMFIGQVNICVRCQQIKKYDKIKRLIKHIEKTPWIRLEEMETSDKKSHEDFLLCKSILIREKEDRLKSCTAFRKEISTTERKYLKGIAQELIELRTGFKPYELTNNVMKNNLPQRIYKMLFDEKENK